MTNPLETCLHCFKVQCAGFSGIFVSPPPVITVNMGGRKKKAKGGKELNVSVEISKTVEESFKNNSLDPDGIQISAILPGDL